MSKFGIVIKPANQDNKTNYSALIGQRQNGEFVLTLFNDEFIVVERFIDVNQDNLIQTTFTYILGNIGDILDVFEIPNDPLLIDMLRRLRGN